MTETSPSRRVTVVMSRDPVTVRMDDTLRHVQELFERHRFHHLPVVEGGQLVGVISDRDLLRNLSPFIGRAAERDRDLNTLNRRVHQIMSRALVVAHPDDDVRDAARMMLAERVSCLPVVESAGESEEGAVQTRLAGILTWRDLLRAAVDGPG